MVREKHRPFLQIWQRKSRKMFAPIKRISWHLFVIIVILMVLFPFIWLVLTSIKPYVEMLSIPITWLPSKIVIDHYVTLFLKHGILNNFMNSLIIALLSTAVSVGIGSLAAYQFARVRTGAMETAFLLVLFSRMVPPPVLIVPIYLMFRGLGLLDTRLAIFMTHVVLQVPLVVWIMTSFFRELPYEIEEAANIDGASTMQIFSRIVLPLSKAGLTVTAIFSFITSWNEFLFAFIISRSVAKTVPVALSEFVTARQLMWGPLSAGGVIFVVPILILSLLLQRHLVRGLTFGAIKQ